MNSEWMNVLWILAPGEFNKHWVVQIREINSIIMLLIRLTVFKEKYIISRIEEQSYIPEMFNNLSTAGHMQSWNSNICLPASINLFFLYQNKRLMFGFSFI